jgi:hypothetical protein
MWWMTNLLVEIPSKTNSEAKLIIITKFEFTIKTIYSCHCLDYRDTILALKASSVSNSTMSGASRFQSRTVLGKNDIFLVSIWYVANNHRN